MYLHNTAGSEKMQDGMFHKNDCKKLEKLRMDRRKQVWYDIYVGRLLWKPPVFNNLPISTMLLGMRIFYVLHSLRNVLVMIVVKDSTMAALSSI